MLHYIRHNVVARFVMLLILISVGVVLYYGVFETKELHPPEAFRASQGDRTDAVVLEWEEAENAFGYSLFRSLSEEGNFTLLADTAQTVYHDMNITPGITYYYRIRSERIRQKSEVGGAVSGFAAIGVPEEFHASDREYANRVVLGWNRSPGADRYALYRARDEKGPYNLLSDKLEQTSYSDWKVSPGVTYYYGLRAGNGTLWSSSSTLRKGRAAIEVPVAIASDALAGGRIKVSWKGIPGVEKYALYRKQKGESAYTLISDAVTSTHYWDRDVVPGRVYHYRLKSHMNGIWSRWGRGDRGYALLHPPTDLSAAKGERSDAIALSWSPVNGALAYRVYRADRQKGPYRIIAKAVAATRFLDREVASGRYYYYIVKAEAQVLSRSSKTARGYLASKAPTNIRATDGSPGKVGVSWDPVAGAEFYTLYRALKPEGKYSVLPGKISGSYFEDTKVREGRRYYYKVRAVEKTFASALSEADSGYSKVSVPTGLTASDGTADNHIALSWSGGQADAYALYRSDTAAGEYRLLSDSITAFSYEDRDINRCRTYYYRIKASKNGHWSDFGRVTSGYGKCGAFVESFAGSGILGKEDGQGTDASFNRPVGIATNGDDIFVADTFNHLIRKITPGGMVTTLAGSGIAGSDDGIGGEASFYRPSGIAVDGEGNLFIAEVDNHLIRKVSRDGEVSTFAGNGEAGDTDGRGKAARFNHPYKLAFGPSGNLFVTEFGNRKVRRITPGGIVSTYAGSGKRGRRDRVRLRASFEKPSGIAVDRDGTVYVADRNSHMIRKIAPDGQVSTVAGSGQSGSRDGKGAAAAFSQPNGLAIGPDGNLYVADTGNNKIRVITPQGVVKSVAGSGESGSRDGYGETARFYGPRDLVFDGSGTLYVTGFHSHTIRKITFRNKPKKME